MASIKEFEHYTDGEIIDKILEGEFPLYELLIRRNNPVLYKTGRAYGHGHEDTQDLMQETFISAYTSLSKFEKRAQFKTWLIRIMLNKCYHHHHKSAFKNEITGSMSIHEKAKPLYSDSKHNDPNTLLMNRELSHVIENSLEKVPIEYRLVFSLREMNGLNLAETAEILNISEANVKVRLHRAKAMLRKEIEKVYSVEELFEFNLVYCDAMVNRVMHGISGLPGI